MSNLLSNNFVNAINQHLDEADQGRGTLEQSNGEQDRSLQDAICQFLLLEDLTDHLRPVPAQRLRPADDILGIKDCVLHIELPPEPTVPDGTQPYQVTLSVHGESIDFDATVDPVAFRKTVRDLYPGSEPRRQGYRIKNHVWIWPVDKDQYEVKGVTLPDGVTELGNQQRINIVESRFHPVMRSDDDPDLVSSTDEQSCIFYSCGNIYPCRQTHQRGWSIITPSDDLLVTLKEDLAAASTGFERHLPSALADMIIPDHVNGGDITSTQEVRVYNRLTESSFTAGATGYVKQLIGPRPKKLFIPFGAGEATGTGDGCCECYCIDPDMIHPVGNFPTNRLMLASVPQDPIPWSLTDDGTGEVFLPNRTDGWLLTWDGAKWVRDISADIQVRRIDGTVVANPAVGSVILDWQPTLATLTFFADSVAVP